tara:strand:+ start:389 stop:916 length:528 start_codon:yes stop_codon:yes gene_type:complete
MNKKSTFIALLVLLVGSISISNAQTEIIDAEQTYSYISSTLYTFKTTGRLVNNPGVDGSDLESFLELLEFYSDEFSDEFNSESPMCEFYLNPENSRMTIEERAQVSFSFLRSLDERVEHYLFVNGNFQEELAEKFGTFLLDNINQAKKQSASHLRLPSASFDEAAAVNFLDSTCL